MEDDQDRYYIVKPKRFSKIEIRDILVSVLVLSIAFLIMFRNNEFVTGFFKHYLGDLWFLGMLVMMSAIVVLSFLLHELGHKFTAQNMGLWSEYRMFPVGLIVTLVFSAIGFLFAAPGVVYISGFVTQEQDGKISLAGPAVNIVLSIIGLIGCIALNGIPIVVVFYLLFSLNAALALFNLLPIGILDGSKIMRWNNSVWLVAIIIAGLLFFSRFLGLLSDLYYTLG